MNEDGINHMSNVDRPAVQQPGSYLPDSDRTAGANGASQNGGPSVQSSPDFLPDLDASLALAGIRVPDGADVTEDAGSGVHSITKKTNYWFEREVGQIEREAERLAIQWAEKGLPRHDVRREG